MTPEERSTKLANTVLDAVYGINEATGRGVVPPHVPLADRKPEASANTPPNKAAADYEGRGE